MDRDEALVSINYSIEEVKGLGSFRGKAVLLKKMNKLKDMINMYKPWANYNELCANEALTLLNIERAYLRAIREARK